MTDYLGMRHRLWRVIWENAGEAIDVVLKEAWDDGYKHGLEDKLDKDIKEDKNGVPGMDQR